MPRSATEPARDAAVRALDAARRRSPALSPATSSAPPAGHVVLALQRKAGNAAVNALMAGRAKQTGGETSRIDAALRELQRADPAIDTVETGLKEAQAVGVPVDLEGKKPPASALAVVTTGFGPSSVAPRKPVSPAKPVPPISPLARAGAKAAPRRTPGAGLGTKPTALGRGGGAPGRGAPAVAGTGMAGAAVAASAGTLLQPPTPPTTIGPAQDPAFVAVQGGIAGAARKAASHPPATAKAREAQDAALAPTGDLGAQAKAAKVDAMDAQQAGDFDKKAFITAVKAAIEAKSPKTLEEADEYAESGKAGEVKGEVQGLVGQGKDGQAKDIETATAAAPDESKAVPKPVTPMSPESPGQVAPVAAGGAAPKPAPADQTNLQAGKHQADQEMAGAEVTEPQLQQSNEPGFQQAVADKKEAAKHADTAPREFRQHEQQVTQQGKAEASAEAKGALAGMGGTKAGAVAGLLAEKAKTKSGDEGKRAEVTAKIQGIFGAAEKEVTEILNGIDAKVDATFTKGEAAARAAFERYVDQKMSAYKKDRYGGWLGGLRWAKDKLVGMPDKVNEFYAAGRELYLTRMNGVISDVADIVGGDLGRAKKRIATARGEIAAYVKSLPQDLQKIGSQAAADIGEKFEKLEADVAAKQEAAVDSLASKYVEARKGLDERIEALQAENKGLVDKAIGAIKGVINTIRELAAMLKNVLARVAGVVGDIIKNPVGFLKNLIAGIKGGILKFRDNIVDHLRKGLMSWLFGALAEGGVELPESFDLKGIIKFLAALFGLTWAKIRSRIVKKIGEPAMGAVEKGVEIFQKFQAEGVGGLWDMLVEKLGDIKEMILEQVKGFVITKIITAGITWLIGLLNPAAAFIKACKLIYDVVMFFVDNGSRILKFVNTVIDSVADVVRGNVSGVIEKINNVLGQMVPIIIGFLASLIGLGGIGKKIREIVETLQKPFTKAIDFVIDKGLKLAGPLIRGLKSLGGKAKAKFNAGKAWVKGKADVAKGWAKGKAKSVKDRFAGKAGTPPDDKVLTAALTEVRKKADAAPDGLRPADLNDIRKRHSLKALKQEPTTAGVTVTAQLTSQSVTLPPGAAGLGHARDATGILPGRVGRHSSLSGKQDPRKGKNPALAVYSEHVLPRNFVDSFLQAMGFAGVARQSVDYDSMTTVLMYQGAKQQKDASDTHWTEALAQARKAGAALRDPSSTPADRSTAHAALANEIPRRAHASSTEAQQAADAENVRNSPLRKTADPKDAERLPTNGQITDASVAQEAEVKILIVDQATRLEEGTLAPNTPVNINQDSLRRLQDLKGVGPAIADRIMKARPFTSVDDLKRVNGIGDERLKWNAGRVVV